MKSSAQKAKTRSIERRAELSRSADEKRGEGRRQVYLSEKITCSLFSDRDTQHGQVLDLNHQGYAIAIPRTSRPTAEISVRSKVQLQISTVAGDSSPILCEVVGSSAMILQGEAFTRYALKAVASSLSDIDINRICGRLFPIGDFLAPQAFADSPVFFSTSLLFRVTALGSRGCTLVTSFSNKSVFLGVPLNLTVLLPNRGEIEVEVVPLRIRSARGGSATYFVDAEFKNVGPTSSEAMSEFLLMAAPGTSLETLRNNGFFVGRTEKSISVSHPFSADDFHQVLQLRLSAYHAAGKFTERATPEEMRDAFDAFSRQLICKMGGEIVGAMRVVFVGKEPKRSEHACLGIRVPDFLFRGGFVELSRACTHTEYRGSEILFKLVQHAIRIAVQADLPYVVANCNSDMWPFYKKIGAVPAGPPFEAFGRKDCRLIYFDCDRVMRGKSGNAMVWNQLVFPVSHFIHQSRSMRSRWNMAPFFWMNRLASALISRYRSHRMFVKFRRRKAANK